ncbi:zf-HC2 domain-containing protein, partial [Cellulosimicrobium sp. CUA-896]|uniref:zf-HC2 domain-containing protein n=1 Tax=Cellulosimicrobium sp. CUA-896 TaxID=1517881 RepID=UPI00165133F0
MPTAVLERSMTVRAFRELPERWRSVLWYTEVEGMGARETGALLGMSAQAAAALAYRAREGLRRAWVQAHLSTDGVPPGCRWTVEHLGDHVRGALSGAARDRVEEHLAGCLSCTALAAELDDVASRLRVVLLPLAVGAPAVLGAVAPAAPASAAPSSVSSVSGAGTAPASGVAAAPAGAAAAGSAAAGSAAAGSTTAAVSTLAGVVGAAATVGTPGALVGLLVAGAVAVTVGMVTLAQPWAASDAGPGASPDVVAAEVDAADDDVDDGVGAADDGPLPPSDDETLDGASAPETPDPSPADEPTARDQRPAGALADEDVAPGPVADGPAGETPPTAVPGTSEPPRPGPSPTPDPEPTDPEPTRGSTRTRPA